MRNKLVVVTLALVVLIGISACGGGYYMVKDPDSGDIYYTEKIEREKGGAVKLKDANTDATVTLQNSEVTEINREMFKANTKKEK